MWIVPPILISTYRCLYLYGHLCILHFCVLHCLKAKCCHYINYFVQNITILSSSKCAIVQIRNDSKIKFIVYCFIFVEIYLTSIMWMENRGGPRLIVIIYMLTPMSCYFIKLVVPNSKPQESWIMFIKVLCTYCLRLKQVWRFLSKKNHISLCL